MTSRPRRQRQVIFLVPAPAVFQTFRQHQTQGLVQRVIHADRRGVVIHPFLSPIRRQQIHIEIPALDLRFAPGGDLQRTRTQRHRRQTGRTAQTFLGAAVNGVHGPLVNPHGAAAERRDRVEQEQRARLVREPGNLLHRRQRAGGRFGVNDGDKFRPGNLFQGGGDLFRLDDVAPRGFDPDDPGATAFRHVAHPRAEHAVDADDDFIPGFNQIDETKFHAGAAGPADGKGQFILSEENLPQHGLDLLHQVHERRVEVADDRSRHRLQNGRRDIARSRAHQASRRRLECLGNFHGG